MGKIADYMVGAKTILGTIIQILGAIGMVAAGLMDYLNGIDGGGLVKSAVGFGFGGNALSQIGIRFAKKAVVINSIALAKGPNEGLISQAKVVGEIVDAGAVAAKPVVPPAV